MPVRSYIALEAKAKSAAYTLRTSLQSRRLDQAVVRIGLCVQIVRLPQVLQRRGRGRSAHYEDISKGLFTRPVRIGARAVGWPDYEVDQLIAAQVEGYGDAKRRKLVDALHAARATATDSPHQPATNSRVKKTTKRKPS